MDPGLFAIQLLRRTLSNFFARFWFLVEFLGEFLGFFVDIFWRSTAAQAGLPPCAIEGYFLQLSARAKWELQGPARRATGTRTVRGRSMELRETVGGPLGPSLETLGRKVIQKV